MDDFTDIPKWIIENISKSISDDPYLNAAGWIIAYYLRIDVTKDFFIPTGDDENFLWHKHVNCVELVGETLFLMRNQPGFEELCERLRKRDFRATYFEMLAAKLLWRSGYEIEFRAPVGIRGQDFDFTAKNVKTILNVEVKTIVNPTYRPQTVINSLNKAREQLPNDNPALIFCAIPDDWAKETADWNFRLMWLGNRFLRGTRRINAVIFFIEEIFDVPYWPAGGALVHLTNTIFNVNPRFSAPNLKIYDGGQTTSSAILANKTESEMETLMSNANKSDFFRWVDYINVRPRAGKLEPTSD